MRAYGHGIARRIANSTLAILQKRQCVEERGTLTCRIGGPVRIRGWLLLEMAKVETKGVVG
jgi:hypothetical protein